MGQCLQNSSNQCWTKQTIFVEFKKANTTSPPTGIAHPQIRNTVTFPMLANVICCMVDANPDKCTALHYTTVHYTKL